MVFGIFMVFVYLGMAVLMALNAFDWANGAADIEKLHVDALSAILLHNSLFKFSISFYKDKEERWRARVSEEKFSSLKSKVRMLTKRNDPDYKSEYEDEEGFELDRFNVEFIIHEEENGVIIHSFPMEIEDRKDFRQRLLDRCIADDLSDEGVFEGKFNEEKSIRELFY